MVSQTPDLHIPVLTEQLLQSVSFKQSGIYVDLTGGCAGHSKLIFNNLSDKGRLIVFDRDPSACEYLNNLFNTLQSKSNNNNNQKSKVSVVNNCFSLLNDYLAKHKITQVDGILADLGISSMQLDDPNRGFSFRFDDSPLDMRMNVDKDAQKPHESAHDFVNNASYQLMSWVFYNYGQEPKSRIIAAAIEKTRQKSQINTCGELAQLIKNVVKYKKPSRRHPATRVFQAIRIYVNDELGELSRHLDQGFDLLKAGGFWAIISFHSLEDRLVKNKFKVLAKKNNNSQDFNQADFEFHDYTNINNNPNSNSNTKTKTISTGSIDDNLINNNDDDNYNKNSKINSKMSYNKNSLAKIIKPFPMVAEDDEIKKNARARSAKMRIIQKL